MTGGPHALYMIWIHVSDARYRFRSIRATYNALCLRETTEGSGIWVALYDEAIQNVTTPAEITVCRLCDLKYPSSVNERLHVSIR